ncbi:MAG TPA: hypothetical protein VJT15_03395 [Pyrinomonadaceae bacterium]|nr:hypothetical protein [Pyrinomonadaceae bacterium]
MEEPNIPGHKSDNSSPKKSEGEGVGVLQWFRESIAGIISLVILAVAALMLLGTFNYAKENPLNGDATTLQLRKDAYDRQKDIMLYALALLGTVTGYYLGRAPAELHAQQAQKSANTAQQQLDKAQTKLTETASDAAAAAAHVATAEKTKAAVQSKLKKATECLNVANVAISQTLLQSTEKTLGERTGEGALSKSSLREAKQEIERTLRDINDLS